MVLSSTGAPQQTVLAPFLFTLYTADFKYNHIQKYSDDTAIVVYIKNVQEGEYRGLTKAFSDWSDKNGLLLNASKTMEMVVDFRRSEPPLQPVNIHGVDIEVVQIPRHVFGQQAGLVHEHGCPLSKGAELALFSKDA